MEQNQTLEREILIYLRSQATGVTLEQLLAKFGQYDKEDVRSAIWPLLSKQEIEITPQRYVKSASTPEAHCCTR